MLRDTNETDIEYRWRELACAVHVKNRIASEDGVSPPVLSTVCSTHDSASECSVISESELVDDVVWEPSQWQSVSRRLSNILQQELLYEGSMIDGPEVSENWQGLGITHVSASRDDSWQDIYTEVNDVPCLQVSSFLFHHRMPWQSAGKRIASIIYREMQDQDVVLQRVDTPENWHAVGSRVEAVLRDFQCNDNIREVADVAEADDLKCDRYEGRATLRMWSDVVERLANVDLRLARAEREGAGDDCTDRDGFAQRQCARGCREGHHSRQKLDSCVDDEHISAESWRQVGCRLSVIFRAAIADEDVETLDSW